MRSDRMSSYEQWSLDLDAALTREYELGIATIRDGEMRDGVERFNAGDWRRT